MKKQFKKSLSLFLAVLMLLSCWVWVAPEKAEAVEEQYTLTVQWNVLNKNEGSASAKIQYKYKDNHGKGTESSYQEVDIASKCTAKVNEVTQVISVNGFPTEVRLAAKGTQGVTWDDIEITLTKIFINDIQVWGHNESISGSESNYYTANGKGSWFTPSWDYSTSARINDGLKGSVNWTLPAIQSVSGVANAEVNAPKLPNGAAVTATAAVTQMKDQYGVAWTTGFPSSGFSYSLTDDNGKALNSKYATVSGSGATATVSVNPAIQTLFPDSKSGNIKLVATYNGSTATSKITVNNPTYTATFHANGGYIGADESGSGATGDTLSVGGDKTWYGSTVGTAPAYHTRDNYEFLGYYPSSNGGTDLIFLGDSTSALNNKVSFKDDETKIDENGDQNWYAAWQAKAVKATFVSADNQVIGTLNGRYDNWLTATNMFKSEININTKLANQYKDSGKTAVKFDSDNKPIYTGKNTNYVFKGWQIIKADDQKIIGKYLTDETKLTGDVTYQAVYDVKDQKTYTVKFKDASGNVKISGSYKYREDVEMPENDVKLTSDETYKYEFIGWAKDVGKLYYTVDENGKDKDGAVIPYTSKDTEEFLCTGDATYVPVFKYTYNEYSVTFSYKGENGKDETVQVSGFHYGDNVTLPDGIKNNYTAEGKRYKITGWTCNGETKADATTFQVTGNITLEAKYDNGTEAEYAINFYVRDDSGEYVKLDDFSKDYKHNSSVTLPTVEKDFKKTVDTESASYTFNNKWSPDFEQTATGDRDYYAQYDEKVRATVTFYNDGVQFGESISTFVGDKVPTISGTPERAEDLSGTYTFSHWEDSEGKEVVPGTDTVTGDMYLNAKYKITYKEYTVTFNADNGEEPVTKNLHYGNKVEVPEKPTKPNDNTYSYTFVSWTPDIDEVCRGNAEYTAIYNRNYRYYPVTWFNKECTDKKTSQFIFGEQYSPIWEPENTAEIENGYAWVIDYWVQCDKNGEVIKDEHGKEKHWKLGDKISDGITSEGLYFKPVYKKEAHALTVTFYDENKTTQLRKVTVAYGSTFEEVAAAVKATKVADDTYHYTFKEWLNFDGTPVIKASEEETETTEAVTIKNNLVVYASYTKAEHDYKVLAEITKAPTCTETGLGNYKCDCDTCSMRKYNVVLPVIGDEAAPEITITLGSNKYKSGDKVNFDDVKYVNAKTNIFVNSEDKGTVDTTWNPIASITRRTGKISYYISEDVVENIEENEDIKWTLAYDYDSVYASAWAELLFDAGLTAETYEKADAATKAELEKAIKEYMYSYESNVATYLSELGLENGKTYIIYVKAQDREVDGKSNVAYACAGKFLYGENAATIEVSGKGNSSEFCKEVTISVSDDYADFKVYIDGEETYVYRSADGKSATLSYNKDGVHTISVTDKNGNISSKVITVNESHSTKGHTIKPTCTLTGSQYDLCSVCGEKFNETTTPATGHKFDTFTETAAECLKDGYRTYRCSACKSVSISVDASLNATNVKGLTDKEVTDFISTLTEDDLSHLKAKGEHTYAKVLDEDGNETDEDKWIIDKAATCSSTGEKHIDCTVCRDRSIVTIEKDANAHSFYRSKTKVAATCEADGYKTHTCKYCGKEEQAETIPATGHTAGEYRIIKEATCTEKGSKILTCASCEKDLGEAVKNADGTTSFDGKAVEIDALEHKLVYSHTVEPTVGENGETVKGYDVYKCARVGCDYTEEKNYKDYLEEFTLSFVYSDTKTESLKLKKGETVIATDIETPTKEANEKCEYVFDYWQDESGNKAEFPITADANHTYIPVFKEEKFLFTVVYNYEDGTQYGNKVGYLEYGSEVTLKAGPEKASDWEYTYTFKCWKDSNSNEYKAGDVVTITSGLNLTATYTGTRREYYVDYGNTADDVETITVKAGADATTLLPTTFTSNKSATDDYHYAFTGWSKAYALTNVQSNVYTSAEYAKEGHNWVKTETVSEATCTKAKVIKKTCECGYELTVEDGKALGHSYDYDTPTVNAETGKIVYKCMRQGCGATHEEDATYTVKFYSDTDVVKSTVKNVLWGTTLSADKIPASATKTDSTYKYTFKSWGMYEGDKLVEVNPAEVVIKSDCEFYAIYTSEKLTFTVNFRIAGSDKVLYSVVVPAGEKAEYVGDTPTKASDATYHYTFSSWSSDTSCVKSNMNVTAVFTKEKHSYTESTIHDATCTEPRRNHYECSCGYSYNENIGTAKGHHFVEVKRVEAANGVDGTIYYKCDNSNCEETKTETIKWQDNTMIIEIHVKNSDGKAVEGAKVQLYMDNITDPIQTQKTDSNGQVVFIVEKGHSYSYLVEYDGKNVSGDKTNVSEGSTDANVTITKCSCACHGDGLWSTIFRFFHKIIKALTGEFKCCNDPDSRYY